MRAYIYECQKSQLNIIEICGFLSFFTRSVTLMIRVCFHSVGYFVNFSKGHLLKGWYHCTLLIAYISFYFSGQTYFMDDFGTTIFTIVLFYILWDPGTFFKGCHIKIPRIISFLNHCCESLPMNVKNHNSTILKFVNLIILC